MKAVRVAVDHPGDGALWSGMRGEMECAREEGQRESRTERGEWDTHTHTHTTIIIMIVPDIDFLERKLGHKGSNYVKVNSGTGLILKLNLIN